MKRIYLVTHPEATHHVQRLIGGWYDSELTERGLRQSHAIAQALAKRLDSARPTVWSSDLQRASRCAQIVADHLDAPLSIDPDLREFSYGEAGGKPKGHLSGIAADDVPGAESTRDAATRIYNAMARILDDGGQHHVIVGHGGTSSFSLLAWLGVPLEATDRGRFGFTSGGITELSTEPTRAIAISRT